MELTMIAVTAIDPDPDNLRAQLGDLDDIAASIKAIGVAEPLIVMPGTAKRGKARFDLVAGHRRLAGAKKAGLTEVPCLVRTDLDAASRLELQLIENLHRASLNPIEEARAFQRLADLGRSQRNMIATVGRSQAHISKRVALLKLPADIQDLVIDGTIPVVDAWQLTRLVDVAPDRILKVLRRNPNVPVDQAVRNQIAEHHAHERGVAAKASLEKVGCKIVKAPKYGFYNETWKPLHLSWPELEADAKDGFGSNIVPNLHVGLDAEMETELAAGHLAAYISDGGRAVYVCTKPDAHRAKPQTTPAQRRQKAQHARECAEREAVNQQRAQVAEARLAFIAAHVGQPDPAAGTLAPLRLLAAWILLEADSAGGGLYDAESYHRRFALFGLDMTHIDDAEHLETNWCSHVDHLLLNGTDKQLIWAAATIAASDGHNNIASEYSYAGRINQPADTLTLDLLVGLGYQPDEHELAKVEAGRARLAGTAAAEQLAS